MLRIVNYDIKIASFGNKSDEKISWQIVSPHFEWYQ